MKYIRTMLMFALILTDTSKKVQRDSLCQVCYVCATCFLKNPSAVDLMQSHCFNMHEHKLAGHVNVVSYEMYGKPKTLHRIRKPPPGVAVLDACLEMNCTKGRKCLKAHSEVELMFWKKIQLGMYIAFTHIKLCQAVKGTLFRENMSFAITIEIQPCKCG